MKQLMKIFIWIPVLVTGILITGFSAQNGNESSGWSRRAAQVIIDGFEQVHFISTDSEKERDILIEKIQYPIRKLAHITEYAIFTLFTYIALFTDGINKSISKISALFLAFLLAVSDELHQWFVPGRNGCIKDVFIDTLGALIILSIITLIQTVSKKYKTLKKQ